MTERPRRERKKPVVTLRTIDDYRQIANRLLSNDEIIAKYTKIVSKGQALDTEFLEGMWPDYAADLQTFYEIESAVLEIEPSLEPDERVKVFEIVRQQLGYRGGRKQ